MSAKQTYDTAKAFLIASKRADEIRITESGTFEKIVVPAIVCAAFSVEIGMKAIILAEGKRVRGHYLDDLFNELGPDSQKRIISAVNVPNYPKREGVTPTFSDAIKKIRNAFVDWRYIHEKNDWMEIDYTFLMQLAQVVQEVAESLTKEHTT